MNSQSPTADEITAAIDEALSVLAPVDLVHDTDDSAFQDRLRALSDKMGD